MTISRLYRLALLTLVAVVFVWSCNTTSKNPGPQPGPPSAPRWLTIIDSYTTRTRVVVNWDDTSLDESGFRIYSRPDSSAVWQLAASVISNIREAAVDNLEPGGHYHFRVTAFNQNGESDPSNEVSAVTRTENLPDPPRNVEAYALSETLVQLTWTDAGALDSFIIQRHDTIQTEWVQIRSLPDNVVTYNDSTVSPATKYFYRVGAKTEVGIAWAVPIDSVTTPLIGVPAPPINLTAEVFVGNGVLLRWRDMSTNETGFEISRSLSDAAWEIIDSVAADSVSYMDILGNTTGLYSYRVRAFNLAGLSAWSGVAHADYRYISRGLIPLAVGNWWEYAVDSNNTRFTTRRTVSRATIFNGRDYYLLSERSAGPTDSLYFLRNTQDQGCVMVHHPLSESDIPQLLFRYPALMLQDSYFVDGHKVEVVVAFPGQDKMIGDTVYHNVLAYDRYFSTSHWVRYWIKPETIGILREEEYVGSVTNPQNVAIRNLRQRSIQQ
jgi:hypothetical protein